MMSDEFLFVCSFYVRVFILFSFVVVLFLFVRSGFVCSFSFRCSFYFILLTFTNSAND